MCSILVDIEQKFNICLYFNDMLELKYFRELIYKIEEEVQENSLQMSL